MSAGGSTVLGGEGSGAAPTAGSAGSAGTAPQTGDGGANAEPTGMGGMPDGMGGQPAEPPEPVCGNGKREGTEECDDMGHEGEDGCNANCEVVCSHFGEDAVKSADNHCYQGYDEADFEGARADCMERGAHLVTISSADENEIAAGFIDNSKLIGAFEMVDELDDEAGTYEWVTGEPFAYENWEQDEPDRDSTRCNGTYSGDYCYSHCAVMGSDGRWSDALCTVEDGYICEWEPAGE
jgi:cysteine-rich repeat protein